MMCTSRSSVLLFISLTLYISPAWCSRYSLQKAARTAGTGALPAGVAFWARTKQLISARYAVAAIGAHYRVSLCTFANVGKSANSSVLTPCCYTAPTQALLHMHFKAYKSATVCPTNPPPHYPGEPQLTYCESGLQTAQVPSRTLEYEPWCGSWRPRSHPHSYAPVSHNRDVINAKLEILYRRYTTVGLT